MGGRSDGEGKEGVREGDRDKREREEGVGGGGERR